MKYKLIVLDLDGTLTNSKKEITPTQPLFALSSDISAANTRCYKQHNNFLWCTQSLPGYWLIQLADSSHWRITELTENSNKP